ncbi:hypothetical protein BKA70DRAFT_1306914 [Coprinopsis sp. MPI-PUGE-AT-0042]|nr:hypothetical protein BKA70DRAFT_1306914 [Coprinopsis sp. MPI-PUGE-AT-0042]
MPMSSEVSQALSLVYDIDGVVINDGNFTHVGRDMVNTVNNTVIHQFYAPPTISAAANLREVVEWLSALNFRLIYRDNLTKRAPGTGLWFLKSKKFRRWLKERVGILWVTGIPGAGKTLLATIILDYLQGKFLRDVSKRLEDHEVLVCFVYCRYTEPVQVSDILAAFVRQALERHQTLLGLVEPLYLRHQLEDTRPSEEELVDLLVRISKSFKRAFYILDGLDEALDDAIKHRLIIILSSLEVHLLITSRPLQYLQDCLPTANHCEVCAEEDDIARLIQLKIEQNPMLKRLVEQYTLREELFCAIQKNARGMFLHAVLQLDRLQHCLTVNDIRENLNRLPPSIEDVYEQTLQRILTAPEPKATHGKRLLLCVLFAQQPLSTLDLRYALATWDKQTFDWQAVIPEESLVALCHGLITVESSSGTVRLIHDTAKDALQRRWLALDGRPHLSLASICIARMVDCGLLESKIQGVFEFHASYRSNPLLEYAYEHWSYHVHQCGPLNEIHAMVQDFLVCCSSFPVAMPPRFTLLSYFSPIHLAAAHNLSHQVSILIGKGYDVNATSVGGGWTPLILAAAKGNVEVISGLLRYSQAREPHVSPRGSFRASVRSKLLRFPSSWRSPESNGGSLEPHGPLPPILVNAFTEDGWTALMWAADGGHIEAVRLLLLFPRIDLNAVDQDGRTALLLAFRGGHEGVIKVLMEAGARPPGR